MADCPHCHGLLTEGAQICPNCGRPVAAPEVAQIPPSRPVNPGQYLKSGWELFKRYPGGFVGFALVSLLLQAIVDGIPKIGILVSLAISVPLHAGFYVVSAKLLQGRTPGFQDFFAGFQFFLPLLLLTIVSSVLIALGFVLLVIPGIFLLVCYLFGVILVVDRRLDFWPAMELSRTTVQPQWFGFFVFFLLLVLINLAGALALGVGLLVSLPVSACAVVAAYADIFGLQSDYSGSAPRPKA